MDRPLIPRIDVGVIARNSKGLIILGKRKNAHGNGDWASHITLFIECFVEGEPQLLEPEKCWGWERFSWYQLPESLFLPFGSFVKKIHARSTIENREQGL